MKKLIEKYKNLRKTALIAKKQKEEKTEETATLYTETESVEKEFPIGVIASTFENRMLAEDYKTIKDFWCFITNEEVDLSNITRFTKIIQTEILNQYPDLKILNYSSSNWFISENDTEYIKNWYKKNNGETIKIKSLKKGYTKVLVKDED